MVILSRKYLNVISIRFVKISKMRFLLPLILFILVGCAQRLKVPINRMMSPETIGIGAEVEYRQINLSEGSLDFTNSETNNSLILGTVTNRAMNIAFGAVENADFFVTVHQESSSLVGLKIQLLGSDNKSRGSGHKISATLALGNERDTYDGEYKIKLKSNVSDYSLIYGYRSSSFVLFYSGISLSQYNFEGTLNSNSGLNNNKILYQANNVMGLSIGMEIGSSAFKFKTEFAGQKITWTNTEEKTFYGLALALTTTF